MRQDLKYLEEKWQPYSKNLSGLNKSCWSRQFQGKPYANQANQRNYRKNNQGYKHKNWS